ncbi:hypothetical protein G7046_g5278 [Stylonectria norvegica]|nr:hypothetical protein G7046_g5278 [Stylonectria norvegica]
MAAPMNEVRHIVVIVSRIAHHRHGGTYKARTIALHSAVSAGSLSGASRASQVSEPLTVPARRLTGRLRRPKTMESIGILGDTAATLQRPSMPSVNKEMRPLSRSASRAAMLPFLASRLPSRLPYGWQLLSSPLLSYSSGSCRRPPTGPRQAPGGREWVDGPLAGGGSTVLDGVACGDRCGQCSTEGADLQLRLRGQAVEWASALTSALGEVDDRLAESAAADGAHPQGDYFVAHGRSMRPEGPKIKETLIVPIRRRPHHDHTQACSKLTESTSLFDFIPDVSPADHPLSSSQGLRGRHEVQRSISASSTIVESHPAKLCHVLARQTQARHDPERMPQNSDESGVTLLRLRWYVI